VRPTDGFQWLLWGLDFQTASDFSWPTSAFRGRFSRPETRHDPKALVRKFVDYSIATVGTRPTSDGHWPDWTSVKPPFVG
jgi:hypothetical protein